MKGDGRRWKAREGSHLHGQVVRADANRERANADGDGEALWQLLREDLVEQEGLATLGGADDEHLHHAVGFLGVDARHRRGGDPRLQPEVR